MATIVQAWQLLKIDRNTHTHTHTITLTLMKTEQAVSIPLKTQISLAAHTFDISVYRCNVFLQFLLSSVIIGIIECVVSIFLSMYIKICKLPNQLCFKV